MSNYPNFEIPVTGSGSTPANNPFPPPMNGPMDLGQVNSQLQMGDRNPIGNQPEQQPLFVLPSMGASLMTDNAGVQHAIPQPIQQANPLHNHIAPLASSTSAVHLQPEDILNSTEITRNGGAYGCPVGPTPGINSDSGRGDARFIPFIQSLMNNGALPYPPLTSSAGMSGSTKCPIGQYFFVNFQQLYDYNASVVNAQAQAPDDQIAKMFCQECKMFVPNEICAAILHIGITHGYNVKLIKCLCTIAGEEICDHQEYCMAYMEEHIEKDHPRDGDKLRGYRMVDKDEYMQFLKPLLELYFEEEESNVLKMLDTLEFTSALFYFDQFKG